MSGLITYTSGNLKGKWVEALGAMSLFMCVQVIKLRTWYKLLNNEVIHQNKKKERRKIDVL